MALVDSIDKMPEGEQKESLKELLVLLFDGVRPYQDASGMWYNIPDQKDNFPGNKLETSGSAMLAYAFMRAYNQGYVSDYIYYDTGERALYGIFMENVELPNTPNMKVKNIYGSSGVGTNMSYYCSNSYNDDDARGIAPLLMAVKELQLNNE